MHIYFFFLGLAVGLFLGYVALDALRSWETVAWRKAVALEATLKDDATKVEQETKTALKVAETDGTAAVAAVRTDVGAAISDVKEAL